MFDQKKTSQVIDETRDAIQEARLAIRRSRQLLAGMRERSELPSHHPQSTSTTRPGR